jgi:hypothetical protein
MSFATAYVIYDGTSGTYVGNQNTTIQINCDRMRAYSPRPCWLLRNLFGGDGTQIEYLLTFQPSSQELLDSNTIVGYFIEVDGQDTMIDIATWQALITACNCPDCTDANGNLVARNSDYASGIPDFVPPSTNQLCITRNDDGSSFAHNEVAMNYTGRYIGIVRHISYVSGVSIYQIQTFYTATTLIPVNGDVIASC